MSSPSDIVMYTPEPDSGASRYVFELTRALASSGWAVTLLVPDNFVYRSRLANETTVQLQTLGERPNDPARGRGRRLWDNLRFLLESSLRQCHAMHRGQILHVQFPLHLPFGLIPFLLAKLTGCRIVFTAHDPLPHKWLLPDPWHRLEFWSLGLQYRMSDRIIVHSAAGRETIQNNFAVPDSKLATIAHGTFELEEWIDAPASKQALRVLLFGSLRENKGIHLAIQAVLNLAAKGIALELIIAGETPNQKEEAYWETCQVLLAQSPGCIQIQKRYIPDSEAAELLAMCDCVLLPYTGFTSDSGVAALALSNARPIVATPAGGLGELLRAAELGIAIDDATVEGVERALQSACEQGRDKLRQLGRNGATYLAKHRSWTPIAHQTGALYSVLAGATLQLRSLTGESQ